MQREAWATDDYKKNAKYATVFNVRKLPVTCEVYEHLVYARSDNPGYIYDIGTELDWSDRPLYDVPGHAVYLRLPRNALYKMYKTTSTVIHLDMFVLRYLQELQVLKLKTTTGSLCYVMTLNSSYNAVPEALLNATTPVSKNTALQRVDWVLSHLTHFTVPGVICVYVCVFCVYLVICIMCRIIVTRWGGPCGIVA